MANIEHSDITDPSKLHEPKGAAAATDGQVYIADGFGSGAFAGLTGIDGYEEGTWTPDLQFGGASTGITYESNKGVYVRIGNLVLAAGSFTLSNKGSATGSAVIEGLPYSTSAHGAYPANIGRYTDMASLNGAVGARAFNADIGLHHPEAGGTGEESLRDTNFTNTTYLQFSVVYIT